jgi:hypothetical protein
MRRPTRRTSQVVALSIFALLAAGCAGVPSAGSSKPAATATVTPRATPSDGAPGGQPSNPDSKPEPKQRSPFAGLARYVASTHYYITAAVYDRQTGQTWVLNPHPGVAEHTASIVKVEIMGAVLKKADDAGGDISPTELSLLQTMIENSNNDSATTLWYDAGGPSAIQSFDDSVGMTGTTASQLQWIPGSTDLPGWGWTTTTALDQVKIVRDFAYPNSLLTANNRHYGLSLMENVESDQAWGVSGGVPAGTTIALKNGWLPLDLGDDSNWQIDSIGWIDGHGRNYVIAVLSQGGALMQDGINAIDYISGKVYAALGT